MKATITGNDTLSKRILLALDCGLRVSAVPNDYPVSLDQAKKLSRFRTMLQLAKDNLEEEHYNRFQLLGIRSLPLSQLFKKADWGGLAEILSVVTDQTTRDELRMLIMGLEEKRTRIFEFKENADLMLTQLEEADSMLRNKELELLRMKKEMDEKIKIFQDFEEPFRSFLGEYLGLYEGELVLAKRLNINWQRSLKKKGIIHYDKELYIHFITNFEGFVEELKNRHKRGFDYRWNPDKDIPKIIKSTPWADVPKDGKYKLPSSFNEPFIDSINELNRELEKIQEKRSSIERKLSDMKKQTIHSYMEMAEVSDFLSTHDLKRHKELQDKVLKWLYQRGFIAVAELTLPNGRRADIFAYNESQIVIFEVKVSNSDLATDHKWTEYLPYCHEFYFATPSELVSNVNQKIQEVNCGQCVETANGIKMIKPDERLVKKIDQENDLKFAAGQLLSKKFIYGF